jgi:heterodisulfide reductase subunit B
MAEEYDKSIRSVCKAVGVDLRELKDWSCCGASSAHAVDEGLALRLAARNLDQVEKGQTELLVPCSSCFQRLKFAQSGRPGGGGLNIRHINEFLDRPGLIEKLKAGVTNPLNGLNVIPYYGCLSQRPPKITGTADPDNPFSMDRVLEALGAAVVPWSYKTDCCGGSMAIARPDLVRKLSGNLFEAARDAGGDVMVTDCPLCQSNLDTRLREIESERGTSYDIPVLYITEAAALAMGVAEDWWWRKHLVDPRPLLRKTGLLDAKKGT